MLGSIIKTVIGGAAAAIGASVGSDVVRDVKSRYRRAQARKDLRRARELRQAREHDKTADEVEELKRKLDQ